MAHPDSRFYLELVLLNKKQKLITKNQSAVVMFNCKSGGELMNKQGHLWITQKLMPQNMQLYKRWLLFGSILPDLLYHTYLSGHTWEAAFDKIIKRMKKLEVIGGINCTSCLYLGYLLHYVEDFFTLPHNKAFSGNLAEHIGYEREFSQQLEHIYDESSLPEHINSMSVEELEKNLKKLHDDYCKSGSDYGKDTMYMKEAVKQVFEYFAVVLLRNQKLIDSARLEALRISSQGFLLH